MALLVAGAVGLLVDGSGGHPATTAAPDRRVGTTTVPTTRAGISFYSVTSPTGLPLCRRAELTAGDVTIGETAAAWTWTLTVAGTGPGACRLSLRPRLSAGGRPVPVVAGQPGSLTGALALGPGRLESLTVVFQKHSCAGAGPSSLVLRVPGGRLVWPVGSQPDACALSVGGWAQATG